MRRGTMWSLCGAALIGAATWAGCTSRTVPLPPPTVEQISSPSAEGYVTVIGVALEEAHVGVLNEDTDTGVIVFPDGDECDRTCPFEAELPASEGDTLRIWQFTGTGNAIWGSVP